MGPWSWKFCDTSLSHSPRAMTTRQQEDSRDWPPFWLRPRRTRTGSRPVCVQLVVLTERKYVSLDSHWFVRAKWNPEHNMCDWTNSSDFQFQSKSYIRLCDAKFGFQSVGKNVFLWQHQCKFKKSKWWAHVLTHRKTYLNVSVLCVSLIAVVVVKVPLHFSLRRMKNLHETNLNLSNSA